MLIDPLGRMEEGQRHLLLDQVASWCGDSHTTVTVKPVIDLNATTAIPGYVPSARQRELGILRDGTCVFPWCTRPARACDLDHVVPYDHEAAAEGRDQPGPTTTDNLVPLCRRHHRLKTHHSGWQVTMPTSGTTIWTSPHGFTYLRDRTGTTALPREHRDPQGGPASPDAPPGRRRR